MASLLNRLGSLAMEHGGVNDGNKNAVVGMLNQIAEEVGAYDPNGETQEDIDEGMVKISGNVHPKSVFRIGFGVLIKDREHVREQLEAMGLFNITEELVKCPPPVEQ